MASLCTPKQGAPPSVRVNYKTARCWWINIARPPFGKLSRYTARPFRSAELTATTASREPVYFRDATELLMACPPPSVLRGRKIDLHNWTVMSKVLITHIVYIVPLFFAWRCERKGLQSSARAGQTRSPVESNTPPIDVERGGPSKEGRPRVWYKYDHWAYGEMIHPDWLPHAKIVQELHVSQQGRACRTCQRASAQKSFSKRRAICGMD
ncbi:hypothetical protein DFH11DRAFT_1541627 [Phellopilus nigrolimitatus]|nr:hypothetical protein DFH11DRAFT_1541627 [Phellopilus nigrolimitatus]